MDASGDDCAGAGYVAPSRWPFLEHAAPDRRTASQRLTEAAVLRTCFARQLPTRLRVLEP